MLVILLGFVTAFVLAYLAIPAIIRVAWEQKWYDRPNERSAHEEPTPALGGIAIFAGLICGIVLWTPVSGFGMLQYVLAALFIVFLIGVKDDLAPLSPLKKLLGQMVAALVLVYKSNVRISSLYGVLGVGDIPEPVSFVLSVIAITGIINAFNLIDGINGLAGSVGLLVALTLGSWFILIGHLEYAVVAFSLAGALMAFLRYNITPAHIFMGDTGAMLTGAVCATLALKFIALNYALVPGTTGRFESAPAIATAVLIIPLFDTLRVISHRLFRGKSPFHPDRSHIHHQLLDAGCTHLQATTALVAVNVLFVVGAVVFSSLNTPFLLLLELCMAAALSSGLAWLVYRRQSRYS